MEKATEPTHVVKRLEGPKVKKSFSPAQICKGKPKLLHYEFGGTGEFQVLSTRARSIGQANCP